MPQSTYEIQQIAEMAQRAVAHANAGTTDSANEIYRLPVSAYGALSWNAEMDAIFRRLPLMLGLSAELRAPGTYKALKVLDVPVLMVRSDGGRVRAFINACRHRGRAVTATHDECGQARGFSCPYHAWRYSLTGDLIAVADPRKFGEVDKATHGLVELACEERAGFVWVCITPDVPIDLAQYLGGMLQELECLEADRWHVHGTARLDSANWKITHDGYLESYHIPFLHKDTLCPMWKRESASSVSLYDCYGPLPSGPHQRMAGNAWGYDPVLMKRMKDGPPSEYTEHHFHAVRTIFPHISISADKHGGLVSQLLPLAADRCMTIQYHVNRRDPATFSEQESQAMRERIALYAKVVRDEDYSATFSIQDGLAAGANHEMLFGRNEAGPQNFHRSVHHYVQAHAQRNLEKQA
jgi:phenylpropionate dioxygenase-like ring-hydroxylating dioxygenase large terminal subunit